MRKMLILCGLPASGKSTFANEFMASDGSQNYVRINRDDLRVMVAGHGNDPFALGKKKETLIREFKDSLILNAFTSGFDVVLDDTHLVPKTVQSLHDLAAKFGDVEVQEKCFNVSVKDCIDRDSKRLGHASVGAKVIEGMARSAGLDRGRKLVDRTKFYPAKPTPVLAIEQDEKLPKAIIVDLDGTLAIIGDRSPYDASNCDLKDHPNKAVIACVVAMYLQGTKVIFMSGRDRKYRPETKRFIEKYCRYPVVYVYPDPSQPDDMPVPHELHMRGDLTPDKSDHRKDSIVKHELFDEFVKGKYNVQFVLDDRTSVCKLWREIGLSCFQVNWGDF